MNYPSKATLTRQFASPRPTSLAFLDNDDPFVKTLTEREKKTEKSVHFATEKLESVSSEGLSDADSLQTSRDVISWLPSEHLYEGDTFVSETAQTTEVKATDSGTKTSTGPTYGTDTFIELDSRDETMTASEFSQSDGLTSSDVFSTEREWKDVTEIVKGIEDLEESEHITHADSDLLGDEASELDHTDSLDAELAREDFIISQINRLRQGMNSSPRSSLSTLAAPHTDPKQPRLTESEEKAKAKCCQALIDRCKARKGKGQRPTETSNKPHPIPSHPSLIQEFGLNPALIDRLKLNNLQMRMEKRIKDLDEDTKNSEEYVQQEMSEEEAREAFEKHVCRQVEGERMEERIQAHLIEMNPVNWFHKFVLDLPKGQHDSWDILYHYKTQLEKRNQDLSK